MRDYDDAVFIQKCKRLAVDGKISREHVLQAIMECMADVTDHIPAKEMPRAIKYMRQNYINALKWQLDEAGIKLEDA